jgi:hypothetical protein
MSLSVLRVNVLQVAAVGVALCASIDRKSVV